MFSVFSLKSKFHLYDVAYYPKKFEKYSQKSLATHFLAKIKVWFLKKFFHHRVAFDQ